MQDVEPLLDALSGTTWTLQPRPDGPAVVRVENRAGTAGPAEMTVTADDTPAGDADISFVAHALTDAAYLLECRRTGRKPPGPRRHEMRTRAGAASAGPWQAFLESTPGTAGSSMIQRADDGPDLYLMLGSDPAPDSYFRFVAWARAGIPQLLDELEHD